MKRIIFIQILVLLFTFNQSLIHAVENEKESFTVKTKSGSFPLTIPDLRLIRFSGIPLAVSPKEALPELPEWFYPHFIPEDPSWLDSAGKFYKEGVVSLFKDDVDLALRRFRKVTDEYRETPWFAPSWFWQGQILVKQAQKLVKKEKYDLAAKKLTLAAKTLTEFLFVLEYTKSMDRYVDYQNISRYTLAWLALKQLKPEEALILIKRDQLLINDNKISSKYQFLKYWTYVQLGKSKKSIQVLKEAITLFHGNFQHVVRLAEYYHRNSEWQNLAVLVKKHSQVSDYYNHASLEYFLRLGLEAEISLKRWEEAKELMKILEDVGVRDTDKQLLAYLRIALSTQLYEDAWENWLKIEDDKIREQTLREIFQRVVDKQQFQFLIERKFDDDYWSTWKNEGQLILAYANLRLGKNAVAEKWLKKAYNDSSSAQLSPSLTLINEETLYLNSIINLLSAKPGEALKNLEMLLENHADSERLSDYYFWYGVTLYEEAKNPMPIIMAMRQVDEAGERDDDRWFLIGKVHYDKSKWQQSIPALKQLKSRHPESPFLEQGLLLLAKSYHEIKLNEAAYESLVGLRNNYQPLKNPVSTITLQVQILMAMEKYEQADELLRYDLKKYPDFKLIKLRVELLKKLGDPKRILDVTGLGLEISTSKNQGFLYFHRANALYETKDYESALTYYHLALKNPPENKDRFIRFQILQSEFHLQKFSEFLKGTTPFLKVKNNDEYGNSILFLVSQHYLDRKQNKKAASFLKQLIANYEKSVRQPELEPENRLKQIVEIGKLYNQLKDYDSAVRWFNQALTSMQDVKDGKKLWQLVIMREQGFALFKLGKHQNALAANLKVSYLDRKLPKEQKFELNLRIATSYVELKRLKEAKAVYKKMLKKFKARAHQKEVKKLLGQLK